MCICDVEEYGLPSMSVKTTPKFENRGMRASYSGPRAVPRVGTPGYEAEANGKRRRHEVIIDSLM